MRHQPTVIANWKMQLGITESVSRLEKLRLLLKDFGYEMNVVVCPSFPALAAAQRMLVTSKIRLGAQDVFWEEQGAYTGEVSPLQLRELDVSHVILGHSERRQLLGETDMVIGRKVLSALAHGLIPILCVGETAHQRNDNQQEAVVRAQVEAALRSAPPPGQNQMLYIAYEPIWAIGTGEPASPTQANEIRQVIERVLLERYGTEIVTEHCRILYGGSVDPSNVASYVCPGLFNGALVGSASLDPEAFVQLLSTIKQCFITPLV